MSLDVNISEPDEFNCVELHSVIEDIAKIHELNDFVYHVDSVCGRGEHYVANLFRVYIFSEENKENKIQVIVKTLLNSSRESLFHRLHEREVLVYDLVLPNFLKIQQTANEKDKLNLIRRYDPRAELHKEVLILEDLSEKSFVMREKTEVIDYEHANLVLENLAKLHALSFVLKSREREMFDSIKIKFHDIIFSEEFLDESHLKNYFTESFSTSVKMITDLSMKEYLEQSTSIVIEKLRELVKPTEYSVLCHGDCWTNNILFKYEEGKPKDLSLLDFQAMRYSSPVTDILYFIYLSTDSSFRKLHFKDLQQNYYECLKHTLRYFEIDVDSVYPEKRFYKDLKDLSIFGFLIAMTELKIVTLKAEDEKLAVDFEINTNVDDVPDCFKLYVKRVNDVVDEFKNNGLFDTL